MGSHVSFTTGVPLKGQLRLIPKGIGSTEPAIGEIVDPNLLAEIRRQVGNYCCHIRNLLELVSSKGTGVIEFIEGLDENEQIKNLLKSSRSNIADMQRIKTALTERCNEMTGPYRDSGETRKCSYFAEDPDDDAVIVFFSKEKSSAHLKWFDGLKIELDDRSFRLLILDSACSLSVRLTEGSLPKFTNFRELYSVKGMGV